jgi:GxxExxY protein
MDNQNLITEKIIGCAIEVHRHLGPSLLEQAYEEALSIEFNLQDLKYQRQLFVPAVYKG